MPSVTLHLPPTTYTYPPTRLPVAALLVAAFTVGPISAQSVRGRVIDDASNAPVPAALVQLLTDQEQVVASGTSSDRGEYLLRASTTGIYRLRVLRIGFRPWVSDTIRLSIAEIQIVELRVDAGVVVLAELRVEARSGCRRRPSDDARMDLVWQQARTVLGLIDAGGGDLEFRSSNRERTLDSYGRVIHEYRTPGFGRGDWPIISQSPDSLARFGFIQMRDTLDGPVYYGPDVAVFFSDAFLTTHCFRLLPAPKGEQDLIGLGFEPVSGRKVPDIEGVLWVHRTAGLSRLEYRYSRMPDWIPKGKAGGALTFDRLPSGRPIITGWSIRAPIPRLETARVVLHGFRQTVGEVEEVRSGSGVVWLRRES